MNGRDARVWGFAVRTSQRFSSAVLLVMAATCSLVHGQENLLPNAGFEQVGADGVISSWHDPEYWSGEIASITDAAMVRGGARSIQLSSVVKGDRSWCRIHSAVMPISLGLRYRYSIWVKGSGALTIGLINYLPERPDKPRHIYTWQEQPTTLSDEWQQVTLVFSAADVDVNQMALIAEVEGDEAIAYLDDAELAVTRTAEGSLSVETGYMMVPVGQAAEIAVRATVGDEPMAGGTVLLVRRTAEATIQQPLTLDADGRASCSVEPVEQSGLVEVGFVSPELGDTATAYVDVVDWATYEVFAAAAAAARLDEQPAHLLFLGDSLTDQMRGRNYVNQVGFWLRKTRGDHVTVRNAGVGGDYITRVWDRLNGSTTVYKAWMYDNLYEPMPTRIFIFLGHNDSKLTSTSDFTQSVVSPSDFDATYREVIEKLRADTGATLTIISATSSLYEITLPTAQKLLETRGAASLFGKPEVLEQFNAIAKKVADETACSFLDAYAPTQNHPDKQSLFTSDGVHMTLEGNRLVALEILRHLSY